MFQTSYLLHKSSMLNGMAAVKQKNSGVSARDGNQFPQYHPAWLPQSPPHTSHLPGFSVKILGIVGY